jgi:hypothetical protein
VRIVQTTRHSGLGLAVDQESSTRVRVIITGEAWGGVTLLGWIEIDLARALDQRVAITVSRLDNSRTGPVDVSVR